MDPLCSNTDCDDLTDELGIIAGTNHRFSDTDGDGLNGGYEVEIETDSSVPDSWDEDRLEGNPITGDAPPVLSASIF